MKVTGISASSFDCYSWCEWKWVLRYVFGFRDTSGAAALLGQMAHSVFETMSLAVIDGADISDPAFDVNYQWEKWFNHYYNKNPEIASQIKPYKLKAVCKGIHELLDSEYSPIRDNTIGAETYFKKALEEPRFKTGIPDEPYLTIRGLIDRTDQLDDETIEIIDYKTGRRASFLSDSKEKKTSSSLREDIQPRMYHLAAQELFPWAKNILVTFLYITDGGPVSVPYARDDIEETKDKIYRRFRAIKSNVDPTRNKTWKCRFCDYSGPDNKADTGICGQTWQEKNELGLDFVTNKYTVLNVRKNDNRGTSQKQQSTKGSKDSS